MICFYCKKEKELDDLRPYGPDCEMVCFECATAPEHKAVTEKQFRDQMIDASPFPVIGDSMGPYPAKNSPLRSLLLSRS